MKNSTMIFLFKLKRTEKMLKKNRELGWKRSVQRKKRPRRRDADDPFIKLNFK